MDHLSYAERQRRIDELWTMHDHCMEDGDTRGAEDFGGEALMLQRKLDDAIRRDNALRGTPTHDQG